MNFTANGITQYDLTRQAKCKCYFVTTPMEGYAMQNAIAIKHLSKAEKKIVIVVWRILDLRSSPKKIRQSLTLTY